MKLVIAPMVFLGVFWLIFALKTEIMEWFIAYTILASMAFAVATIFFVYG